VSQLREVLVPDIGDIDVADVIEVMVAPGARVEIEEALIALESNKAIMEIPSPYAGIIVEVMVSEGGQLTEGQLILTLEEQLEPGATEDQAPEIETSSTPEPAATTASEPQPQSREKSPAPPPVTLEETIQTTQKAHASPGVRRFARELGVDLALVTPSGPEGRVQKQDILAFVKEALIQGVKAVVPDLKALDAATPDYSKFGEIETQPLSRTQIKSAARLQQSWQTVPHVTQFDETDITELDLFRREQSPDMEKQGFKLTLLAFILKASAVALKQFPQLNASLDASTGKIILKNYFHFGFAVDTEGGLVVPVIKNVDQKGLFELAQALSDLTIRAREQRLELSEMQGASFTISSLGGISGTGFTPIINSPEAAILGVSQATIRPVYQCGDFVPRLMLPYSLSYDHRIVNGAEAARFTRCLAKELADIRNLLL
jgi:pyruvate dehydrogenase E2 component (dihydrolipoamide acetyltransferase)